ncbi:GMC family oxidoreductase N-terminal domain-containing protein [Streptomyces sp. NPDC050704]|uniref:GMC family oxidoreductase n=1 Tax=Streptomyces sp. NPDC050704 TaxID=3157219 RepID=UPI0034458CFA
MRYDTVIVGGGAAGGILAARATEDPECSVLLLEAGPDFGPDPEGQPPDVINADDPGPTDYDWGLEAELGTLGRRSPVFAGRLLGGSSATNNVMALRGRPADYDAWASAGNHGWSYEEVLADFVGVERDLDFGEAAWHGDAGPVPVCRPGEPAPVQQAFLDACATAGHPAVADHNAPGAVGAGPLPLNQIGGVRQSTALTCLATARERSNLTIRGDATVDRVLIDRGRCLGVRLAGSGEEIEAGQVVLTAGAYGSPVILLRSGIGPADHLRPLGIPVTADLPGVGANLHDHPLLRLLYASHAPAAAPPRQTLLTTGPGLQIFPSGPEQGEVLLLVALMAPHSRGHVRLRSPDPYTPPDIDVGLLRAPEDAPRLLDGVHQARRLARTPPLSRYLDDELWPGPTADPDDALHEGLNVYQHPVGTCRMGPPNDPHAVVTPSGHVHGLEGLRVADASIMPTIPRANTHLPTLMLAEHLA